MLKDISMHRPIWVIFDGAKYLVSCRCATQRGRSNIAEHIAVKIKLLDTVKARKITYYSPITKFWGLQSYHWNG